MQKKIFPQKISNLVLLREKGVNVPSFYVLDTIKNIDEEMKKIYSFLKKENIKNIIIRSAFEKEDSSEKSFAGFFESSTKISSDNLKSKDIKSIWDINKKKINNEGKLYLFIQEFYDFDFSGVLFTQDVYNRQKALLKLSKKAFAITSGLTAQKNISYDKNEKKWDSKDSMLGKNKSDYLEKIIYLMDQIFLYGADVELGIAKDNIYIVQARAIVRNNDEKILYKEQKRLFNLFNRDFCNQVWVKNNFTDSLGDLSPLSVHFYNDLFASESFYSTLNAASFLDKKDFFNKKLRILENIGNRTYFNATQGDSIFFNKEGFIKKIKRIALIKIREEMMKNKNELNKNEKQIGIEIAFSWLFLSGLYFQFFLEEEKIVNKKNFKEKLKNTELFLGVNDGIRKKVASVDKYFLNNPYDLLSQNEIKYYDKKISKKYIKKELLSSRVVYWFQEKIYWKKFFLEKISNEKNVLIKKYKKFLSAEEKKDVNKLFSSPFKRIFLSNKYQLISGENYPFFKSDLRKKEVVVVPGVVDRDIIFLKEDDDITKYNNKAIAIDKFPNSWIPFVPNLKSIITKEGNELSHLSISCREYSVPYLISPIYFNQK